VQHDVILGIVEQMLDPWCDKFQLNLTQAIEIAPGSQMQAPHRDQDMWGGPKGEIEYLVNVMWPFTEYTVENGATRLWRGSHRCQEEIILPEEDAEFAEMEPGSVLIFLGSTLHGGSANVSAMKRRGMIVSYCLGWLKPYENQWLAYPPAIARNFSPELARLVGYFQHRPNLGNYEGRCPSILLQDDVPEHPGAKDELRPDQEELIAAYLAGDLQRAA
jgi:ectoine hydroxylase-related dioxygenase (phytanoyl-CoA dioxygenase family)